MDSVLGKVMQNVGVVLNGVLGLVLGMYIYLSGFPVSHPYPTKKWSCENHRLKTLGTRGTFLDIPSWSVITVERYGKTYVVVKCAAKIRRRKKNCAWWIPSAPNTLWGSVLIGTQSPHSKTHLQKGAGSIREYETVQLGGISYKISYQP